MLILLSLLAAQPTAIAVEVTGMDPQLELAEQTARMEGWTQICSGTAGEETVLRFSLPPGWTEARLDQALGGERRYVSGYRILWAEDQLTPDCDQEPVTSKSDASSSLLAFGPTASLSPLVKVAQSCGFRGAFIRDLRQEDIPDGSQNVPADFKALDAGENLVERYGPAICYLQMAIHKQLIRKQ